MSEQSVDRLHIVTWNINSVRNKLENARVRSVLSTADIILLNEIKTPMNFHLPGYVTYTSEGSDRHRGGCAVLLRNHINDWIVEMDCSKQDLISFRLRPYLNVRFVSIYIPPRDSPYFSMDAVANLNSLISDSNENLVVLGDMNCRFATLRDVFLQNVTDTHPNSYYAPSLDSITSPNENAKTLAGVLGPLVLVNGFCSDGLELPHCLTFRQKHRWISELDHCFISPGLMPSILNFRVEDRLDMPSNHAPVFVAFNTRKWINTDAYLQDLEHRASELGDHTTGSERKSNRLVQRQLKWSDTNHQMVTEALSLTEPPVIDATDTNPLDVNVIFQQVDATMSRVISGAAINRPGINQPSASWKSLADNNDARTIWNRIGWNGSIGNEPESCTSPPSDHEFKLHFEDLLNPADAEPIQSPNIQCPYLPVTDDAITPQEVEEAISTIKPDKSGGPSGIPPGVLKALPINWIWFLATVFTAIFFSATIPVTWSICRLIVIFKKGTRSVCGNYRGIAIMDTFAKIYDRILCLRLERWFRPLREQAGAQRGRGCTEHILGLRLLIDYAISKKSKLFITYVDFSKAYDKVPRNALIQTLCRLGCGYMMVLAISSLYSDTRMVLGAAVITATIGVRQGSPTSCLLFTLYIDELVKVLRQRCPNDGFLRWISCLLLMDDTILLSTTREGCIDKLGILTDFCNRSGMEINQSKTNFMVINGSDADRSAITVPNLTVENCPSYTYLGVVFTQDGKVDSSVKQHILSKQKHVAKFAAFVAKNIDFPFWIKRRVMDAALMTSVLYGCESWIGRGINAAQSAYMTILKTMLGVRQSTPNDLILLELGYPSLQGRVRDSQRKFLQKILAERSGMVDDPLMEIWNICRDARTRGAKYLEEVLDCENHAEADTENRKASVSASERTKSLTYCTLNPDLSPPAIYDARFDIKEYERIATSRLRLSAHHLAIETGRWSRVPADERFCPCGSIQTEEHIICQCPLTSDIRAEYESMDFSNIHAFFHNNNNQSHVCSVASKAMATFD